MKIAALFRTNGLKVTPQRRVVYNVLGRLCHASVEQIVEEVSRHSPDISVATVYNILDCFAKNNIISRLSTPQGRLFYDITPDEHHHIIADQTKIIDYQNDELTGLLERHFADFPLCGMLINRMTLQIYATTQN